MNAEAAIRVRCNQLALLVFLATVVMLFAAFTSAYLIRRTGSDWRTVTLPGVVWINTALLLISSVTTELAIAFLGGQALLWRALSAEGVALSTSSYGSFVYLLSAVHGALLIGGVLTLLLVTIRQQSFALCAVYWQFLTGVWVYLVLILRLL
jgi:cytochrome c oxidase subunit 3